MFKKTLKIAVIFILVILLLFSFSNVVFGAGSAGGFDFSGKIQGYLESPSVAGTATSSVGNVAGTIVGAVQVIGTGIALIMLTVLGMKYMLSAPGDRAEIKKHAVVYVIGAVVLFGASGLLGIIYNFAQNDISQ